MGAAFAHTRPKTTKRVKDSERCLEVFKRDKKDFLRRYMASVFWDAHGILFVDYLEKCETINCDYDVPQDPPYSSDLAPSDYWLFGNLKKMLQGKRFGSNEEVISETETYFESKDE